MVKMVLGTAEYKVDTVALTCTCPHFTYRCSSYSKSDPRRICKHLARFVTTNDKRFSRAFAEDVMANHLSSILKDFECIVCGSYRRGLPTVGDIDILIVTDDFAKVVKRVSCFDILWSGRQKVSFTVDGIQVDLRRADSDSFVTMCMYFTGSKEENIRLRRKAVSLGYKLNEYGLWNGSERIPCATEEDVYTALGLAFVAPNRR